MTSDAVLAASLLAVDPGLGVCLRGAPGSARAQWLALLRALLPVDAPMRRCPLQVSDEQLLGGLDLAATLQSGRRVDCGGLLADADGGVVLLQMAERIAPRIAARLAGVLDTGEVMPGVAARVGLVALDEGIGDEERPCASLLERLALTLSLDEAVLLEVPRQGAATVRAARARLAAVEADDELVGAFCSAAASFGVGSVRAPLLALRAARAAAALRGALRVGDEDAAVAARLVLAPRATRLPEPAAPPDETQSQEQPPPEPPPQEPPEPPPPAEQRAADDPAQSRADAPDQPEAEEEATDRGAGKEAMVQDAMRAAQPADLLSQLQPAAIVQRKAPPQRGRPIGARRGDPARGRLNLLATLRAALPWQTVRRAEARARGQGASSLGTSGLVQIRREDFRITRFAPKSRITTIFAVDASGSAARARLAEAKGCVELLLAECYVRRDQVALISFGGTGGALVLPPTGSVVRARRCLSGLPGGGGTPLAAGLDAAVALAERLRRQGEVSMLVLLTDGKANVARDGTPGRARAEADALESARRVRAAQLPSLLVDIAPRAQPRAASLAAIMGARYLPLPQADASAMSRAVRAAAPALA